jgi:hypothetical protein
MGKIVCLVSCQRSPGPVFLGWKDVELDAGGDLYARHDEVVFVEIGGRRERQ